MFPTLEDHWHTLDSPAFDKVLAQIVDIFVRLWSFSVPGELYGGLAAEIDGSITTGPLVEESMWQSDHHIFCAQELFVDANLSDSPRYRALLQQRPLYNPPNVHIVEPNRPLHLVSRICRRFC